ncbi:Hypothetical predicted protein [Octopus vulgaris]|uniref:Uncharacterized protein n=1 Tax=Octopus vulgaris TaxID=6645 RepID=A0AA36BRD1_OCTVU|nr:Hypothetical predicted protein [Octopus vulgaris]
MATRARSGRHWAQCCPRLRDNSERYGDQSSLWAPLGSMLSAATRQQARSERHWAQCCPRLRDNSERYGDRRLALGAIGLNVVRGYETTVSAMATRARSGRHWAQCCPRLRDNSERYGDQSSLWAPLGSMLSAATRQQ